MPTRSRPRSAHRGLGRRCGAAAAKSILTDLVDKQVAVEADLGRRVRIMAGQQQE